MRRLLLIRHAKAEPGIGQNDYERALTERGRADAARLATFLATREPLPAVLIHSGALRTKQTAEIFAAHWPRRVELQQEIGLYDATQEMLLHRAQALADPVACVGFVGHNPGIGELAVALSGQGAHSEIRRMAMKFPTCAVAEIDFDAASWDDIGRRTGLLSLFLTPSDLEAETD